MTGKKRVYRTRRLVEVAEVLMQAPDSRHYGYDLRKRAGIRSGVVYRILTRLLDAGWLTDGWEDQASASSRRRPQRRYYEVTDAGKAALAALLVRSDEQSA